MFPFIDIFDEDHGESTGAHILKLMSNDSTLGLSGIGLIAVISSILLFVIVIILSGLLLYYKRENKKLRRTPEPVVHYSDVYGTG